MGQTGVSKNGKRLERGTPKVEAEQREQRGLGKKVLAGAGKGAIEGAGQGSTVGSAVPGLGTVSVGAAGGVAGAVLGAKAARAETVQEQHEKGECISDAVAQATNERAVRGLPATGAVAQGFGNTSPGAQAAWAGQHSALEGSMSARDAAQSVKARHQAASRARDYMPSIPIEQPVEDNICEMEG